MRRGRAAAGGQWNKQTGKQQSTRTRVSREATATGFSTNWERVERPPHRPAWKPNTQVTEREGETTRQDLNFFFLLLFPLRIKVYLKVYYTAPTTDYVGTIISLDRSTGGVSACLAFLPVTPPMGPLCRLQGHQLGATLHQYFILSSQNISKWKSHGREIFPPYPAACLRSSYSPPHLFLALDPEPEATLLSLLSKVMEKLWLWLSGFLRVAAQLPRWSPYTLPPLVGECSPPSSWACCS